MFKQKLEKIKYADIQKSFIDKFNIYCKAHVNVNEPVTLKKERSTLFPKSKIVDPSRRPSILDLEEVKPETAPSSNTGRSALLDKLRNRQSMANLRADTLKPDESSVNPSDNPKLSETSTAN